MDRLGWAAGFTFRAYGLDIGVRATSASVLDRVTPHLPFGWTPASNQRVDALFSIVAGSQLADETPGAGSTVKRRRFNMLYADGTLKIRTLNPDDLFDRLESDIRLQVAEFAKRRVFVHAGVVAWNGRAILIPGRSLAGKSTLVSALVQAGAVYYSDEYAVLDARGRVHPFLKPLSLRAPGETEQTHVPVEDLGGVSGTRPLPVGAVVVTEYGANATWRPRELTEGGAVLALLANTVPARRNPQMVLSALTQIARTARTIKTRRPEAAAVVDEILRELRDTDPPRSPAPRPRRPTPGPAASPRRSRGT